MENIQITETDKSLSQTIHHLFETYKNIRIPAYQRAYSWEEKQCTQFFDDLVEQKGKKYYLGQFLFEKDNNLLNIVDGQQRITTTIIFISAIAKILSDNNYDVSEIRDIYLNNNFKTIDDDQIMFKKVTQKHLISASDDTDTLSQRRIINAFLLFTDKLKVLSTENIFEIKYTLENALISTFFITNKVEATQIFEYQNNRGKELSRFEIIKAYLMHQVYINGDEFEVNNDISEIQSVISKTYRYIETTEGHFTESELLDNYCNLYFSISGSVESIKDKLSKEKNKTQWIKDFFEYFAEWTLAAKSVVKNKQLIKVSNLFLIGNEANWKLVLLAIHSKGEANGETYLKILKLLEVLCFKLKLGNYRSDHLPGYTKSYFNIHEAYNIDNLYNDIRNATVNGFKWYWNNENHFNNIIVYYFDNNNYHYNRNIIKFILWQYENDIRIKNKSGALMDREEYDKYTIEHIAPQNPKKPYSQRFIDNHLHKAGNLSLLTQSQNSKFSNKSYKDKDELFQDTALSSYTEIRNKGDWNKDEIDERHLKISDFAKKYFDTADL